MQPSREHIPGERVPDVRKIAVVRANGLGDMLFGLPALEALRAAYPQAEIVLLARAWHHALFTGRPGPIDRVIVIPPVGGVGEPEDLVADEAMLERFFQQMRAEHFDLALQMHGGGRHSNPFTRRLGARLTIGLRADDAAPLDLTIPYIYYQSEIMRYLEVVSLVGATPVSVLPHVPLTTADRTEAARVVPESEVPLVALHPGATDPRRRWAPRNFAAVADALARAWGAQICVVGTPEEREIIQAVLDAAETPLLDLCGTLTVGGLAALLARCQVLVANDSGPMHVAVAVGTPTVGVLWCGNMITAAPPIRATYRPLISWRLECPVCSASFVAGAPCNHRVSVVDDIAPAEVLDAVYAMLSA